jgi:thiol:disulfide interchange protein DsbA
MAFSTSFSRSRRELSGLVLASAVCPATLLAAAPFDEGIEYRLLAKSQPTAAPAGKVEVLEFFWYSCGHCYNLEPALLEWKKSLAPHVYFRRSHVAFRGTVQQQLYFTLSAMGLDERLGPRVFESIHVERNPLQTAQAVMAWAKDEGLAMKEFESHWNSSRVASAMRRATDMMQAHEVDSVPRFTIAGRYVTAPAMNAGSHSKTFAVINHLVELSRGAGSKASKKS